MAISQYDNPAQSDFINTYSPIPFNELMQAGAIKQKQYETGLDNLMQTYEDTHNLKYIPESKDEQYIKNEVIPTAKNIVDKYSNMDLSDPVVRRQMRTDFNTNIDKNRIKDIQDSFSGWQQNQQWRQKLKAEGKYQDFLDTPDIGYDTSVMGTYQKLTPAAMDFRKEADEYFTGIEGDSYTDPITKEIRVSVNPKKIENIAADNVQTFLETTAGQQKVLQYKMLHPDTKATPQQIVYEYLLVRGKKKLYNRHQVFLPEHKTRSKEKEKEVVNPIGGIESIPMVDVPTSRVNPTDFDKKNAGETNFGKAVMNPSLGLWSRSGKEDTYLKDPLFKPEVQSVVKMLPKVYQDYYTLATAPTGTVEPTSLKNAQDKLYPKLKEVFNNVDEHLKKGTYVESYTPKARKEMTDYVLGTDRLVSIGAGNLPNRKYYDPETHKLYTNSLEFYKNVIVPEIKKNKEGLVSVNGRLNKDNPFSHPMLTNDPEFRNGYEMTFGSKAVIVSGGPTTDYENKADETYNRIKYIKNTDIEDESVPGLTMRNNGRTYSFKYMGTLIAESPDFDEAYNTTFNTLKSTLNK